MALPPFVIPFLVGTAVGTATGASVAKPREPQLLSGGQVTEISRAVIVSGVLIAIGLTAVIVFRR